MSKHGQDHNEQFTSQEMFEMGRKYERERIRQWVEQRISHDLGNVITASDGAYRPTAIEIAEEEAHNRAIKCVLEFLTPTKTDKQ